MGDTFQELQKKLKPELVFLWIFSVLLGLALIALDIKEKLPLRAGDFTFISIIFLCVALYRPRWVFYLFISLISLENVILISGFVPFQLRPYQYAGIILAIALAILWTVGRLNFRLLKPAWIDWLVFSLVPLSFLPIISASARNVILKNNLILISFVILYFLVRTFVRTRRHFFETAGFFFASNLIVLVYGFWQVFADKFGLNSFEVFFGRPNSTFTEPDWLGLYLSFSIAFSLWFIYSAHHMIVYFFSDLDPEKNGKGLIIIKAIFCCLFFLNITLLILTLARSAWIGATTAIFLFLFFSFFEKENKKRSFDARKFAGNFLVIFAIVAASLSVVYFSRLSKFDIFDRARSAATSEQKITIACNNRNRVPEFIADTKELAIYDCLHVNLEDIEYFKSQGKYVAEIFRKDPNVITRSAIYKKSFEIIRNQSITGVGYGTISQFLGSDERGSGLNESNIFLQVWAGSGLFGLFSFVFFLVYLCLFSLKKFFSAVLSEKTEKNPFFQENFEKTTSVLVFLGIFALLVPNFFNAGLFMGIWWIGLGILTSLGSLASK